MNFTRIVMKTGGRKMADLSGRECRRKGRRKMRAAIRQSKRSRRWGRAGESFQASTYRDRVRGNHGAAAGVGAPGGEATFVDHFLRKSRRFQASSRFVLFGGKDEQEELQINQLINEFRLNKEMLLYERFYVLNARISLMFFIEYWILILILIFGELFTTVFTQNVRRVHSEPVRDLLMAIHGRQENSEVPLRSSVGFLFVMRMHQLIDEQRFTLHEWKMFIFSMNFACLNIQWDI